MIPIFEMAPFVPGGTLFRVVISLGGDFERIPSSEARVSPRQHAKWLEQYHSVSVTSSKGIHIGIFGEFLRDIELCLPTSG